MIDPFKQILDRHADAQGWDADTREHVLLQFVANAADLVGTASDLDTFLTDLTADAEAGEEEADPRLRCYGHVEQLQEMLTSGSYNPSPAHWARLDALLGDVVDRITADALLESAPAARYYVALSVPLPEGTEMGPLPEPAEAAIKAAFADTPGTVFDGSGSGMGARQFFGKTTHPAACAEALEPFLGLDGDLNFRRLEDHDA